MSILPPSSFLLSPSVLWLAPTWRVAAEVRSRLLDGAGGCFSPGVTTFAQFAESVLAGAREPIRPISPLMKRHLLRRLLDWHAAEGRLKHFAAIAATSGLLDLVCDFISELKRLEIWPEQFRQACCSRGIAAKDEELLAIYEAYQECLLRHHLYDVEGRFWSARDLLKERTEKGTVPFSSDHGARGARNWDSPLENRDSPRWRLVVADGFNDFTRTQHEILETLAGASDEIWISLPTEPETWRRDLFQKPLGTLAELRRRHPGMKTEEVGRPDRPSWPAMARLERTLFVSPRNKAGIGDWGLGIGKKVEARQSNPQSLIPNPSPLPEILAAGRRLGEIELIGSRIKRLLTEGDDAEKGAGIRDWGLGIGAEERDWGLEIGDWEEAGRPPRGNPAEGRGWKHASPIPNPQSPIPAFQSPIPNPQSPILPVRPGQIAVVFRRPQDVAELVAEVFGRLGIPLAIETQRPLSRSPILLALVRMLREEGIGDWGLGIGKKEEARQPNPQSPIPNPSATLAEWGAAWQRLADRAGLRRDPADQSAWDRLQDGLQECLRLDRWLGEEGGGETRQGDKETRRQGDKETGRQGDKETRRPQNTPCLPLSLSPPLSSALLLDRRRALAALLDILGSQGMGGTGDEATCVRVLSAAGVRGLRVPYLFFAGLDENSFPAGHRDDRLYSEAERRRLMDGGLPLPSRADRQSDEMLLFYEAVTSATRRLYLSYPAVGESGEPLLPSPYLKEVEQAMGPGGLVRTQRLDLSPVPEGEPLSLAAFRLRGVAAALAGDVSLLAGLIRHDAATAEGVLSGLGILSLRQDRRRFGAAEGMLSPAATGALAARFGPARTYSVTELENYADCPYRFFLQRVLRIEPVEELKVQIDYRRRGLLLHAVLAELHRRINRQCGGAGTPSAIGDEEYRRLVEDSLDQVLAAQGGQLLPSPLAGERVEKGDSPHLCEAPSGPFRQMGTVPFFPLQAALDQIDRRVLLRWIDGYRSQHDQYDQQWRGCEAPLRPEFFEVSFGLPGEGLATPSTAAPLDMAVGEKEVRLSGRIDRIDTGRVAGREVFNIVDYKTGQSEPVSPGSVARGTTLQLPLYALAAAELMLNERDAIPWQAGYWHVPRDGFKPRQSLKMHQETPRGLEPTQEWEEIRQSLPGTVVGLVEGIRRGEFPVWNEDRHCTGSCPYKTVCRINQVRSLEKTWEPRME